MTELEHETEEMPSIFYAAKYYGAMENRRVPHNIQQQDDELPITPAEAALVDKRIANMDAYPEDRLSSTEVWARIERKYL